MYYDYPLYRPPSEAYSLILQVTLGCSHNACTFCTMYKTKRYTQKSWPEIEKLIGEAAMLYPRANRIFLADGNVLAMPTAVLTDTLDLLYRSFNRLERISCYGGPNDALRKTPEELRSLREKGLALVYMGIESGSDSILKKVKKGATAAQIIEAGRKILAAGIGLSATIITGLGGREQWEEHAIETARVVSAINPTYLGSLTLMLEQGAPILRAITQGELTLLTPAEILREIRLMIEHVELENCTYRSNHASNYFRLAGVLNRDKKAMLQSIDRYLAIPTWVPCLMRARAACRLPRMKVNR